MSSVSDSPTQRQAPPESPARRAGFAFQHVAHPRDRDGVPAAVRGREGAGASRLFHAAAACLLRRRVAGFFASGKSASPRLQAPGVAPLPDTAGGARATCPASGTCSGCPRRYGVPYGHRPALLGNDVLPGGTPSAGRGMSDAASEARGTHPGCARERLISPERYGAKARTAANVVNVCCSSGRMPGEWSRRRGSYPVSLARGFVKRVVEQPHNPFRL